MNAKLLHYYRKFREHQWAHNGGGAAEGEHALCAYWSARSHIHFLERLRRDLAEHKRRSKAANRGWKKRRAG